MKHILLTFSLLFVMNAKADIDANDKQPAEATAQEIQKSRACFQEVEAQGCGRPSDDHRNFRSCAKNVKPRLNADCKKMMSKLYGV